MKFAFVLSEDTYLAQKKIATLEEAYKQKITLPFSKKIYWADESLKDFWQDLSIASLESSDLLIVLRNAHVLNVETWRNISESLGLLRDHIFVIFVLEATWDNKNAVKIPSVLSGLKCFTYAEKKQWVFYVPPLNGKTMEYYVHQGLLSRQLSCSQKMEELLVSTLSCQGALIDNSLDQLALMAENNKVEEEHIKALAAAIPEIMLFDYIKLLEAGRSVAIWKQYIAENNGEGIFFPFVGILTREARLLWQVFVSEPVKLPPYIIDSKKKTATKLGASGIIRLFALLLEAEWTVKSGRLSVNQALDALLVSLSELYG